MTDEPMNPYRRQAVDWLNDFADLAEGKTVNGVAGDPEGDPRLARALRIAAQQIGDLPAPKDDNAFGSGPETEPKSASEDAAKARAGLAGAQSEDSPPGDLAQKIAVMSENELDQAMAASVPPENAPNDDV